MIQKRLIVYDVETKPVLEFYPPETIERVDATMSQIRVLSEIVKILVPLKEEMDGHPFESERVVRADSAATTMEVATAAGL